MRPVHLLLFSLATTAAWAQPCAEFQACFVPSALPSGNYLFGNCSPGQGNGQFVWDFGDGTPQATTTNAEHAFLGPGTYEVCLTGYWGNCADSTCVLVVVQGEDPCTQLQAGFFANTGAFGVQFSNSTTGTGQQTIFSWTFGDGGTSDDAQPFHMYAVSGTYEVCLTVVSILTGDNGQPITCQDVHCAAVTIAGQEPCSPNFVVAMDWVAQGNNEVAFVATSTFPNTNFIWYFGDGTEADGSTADHTYAQAGSYYACVTGWYYNESAQDTCWIEDCATVVVDGQFPCDELIACFQPSQLSSSAFFFNNCSSAPFGSDLQFLWNFGDGTSSTEPAPIHTFPANGVYAVCLTTYWGECEESTCLTITVGNGDPCDLLDPEFTPFVGGFGVNIQNAVINNEWTYLWTFGDGSTGYGPSTGHQYTAPGTYNICLTLYTWDPVAQDTCFADHCETVIIAGQACDPNFAVEMAWNEGNDNVVFFNATSNHPNTYFIWYFGDGTEADGPLADHTYAQEGSYYACVTGWYFNESTQDTCWIEDCETILIGEPSLCDELVACFEALPFENGAFLFENCSQVLPIDIPWYAFWDFGDGSTSTEVSPTHGFAPGIYSVCVTITHGTCVDTTCTTITVNGGGPDCDPNYSAGFTYQVQNNAVIFFANFDTPTMGVVWTFPDGSQATEPIHTHLFEPPGPFEVCLSAWYWNDQTQDTCWASHCSLVDPFGIGTGMADITLEWVSVFPVPANDLLTVTGLPATAMLRLYSADGRLVHTERTFSYSHRLRVTAFASGTYVLHVDADGRSQFLRVAVE